MIELKKSQMSNSLKIIEGSKGFEEKYMWYDNPNFKHSKCDSYKTTIKDDILYFKDEKIRHIESNEPLKTNFEKKWYEKNWWRSKYKRIIPYKKKKLSLILLELNKKQLRLIL